MVYEGDTAWPEFRPITREDWPRECGDVPDLEVQQAIVAIALQYRNLDEYQVAAVFQQHYGYIDPNVVAAVVELVLPGRWR